MEDNTADIRSGENSAQRAQEQRTLILAEIKAHPNHVWAGSYYMGDGKGVNVSFVVAPLNGYVFQWRGCLGLYDRNFGRIELLGDHLRLSFTFANVREGFRGIAEELLPIYWGDRTYLVPTDEILQFCNDINSGAEPRNRIYGHFLLRDGDEEKSGFRQSRNSI